MKAGVKRFIPSEFGLNTQKVTGGTKKILGAKIALQEQLEKTAKAHPSFSWTGVSTGLFFDWVCSPHTVFPIQLFFLKQGNANPGWK